MSPPTMLELCASRQKPPSVSVCWLRQHASSQLAPPRATRSAPMAWALRARAPAAARSRPRAARSAPMAWALCAPGRLRQPGRSLALRARRRWRGRCPPRLLSPLSALSYLRSKTVTVRIGRSRVPYFIPIRTGLTGSKALLFRANTSSMLLSKREGLQPHLALVDASLVRRLHKHAPPHCDQWVA